MARVILAIALTVTLGPAALAQQPSSTPANAGLAQSSVDRLFAQWDKPDTPGCALAVIKDGQIIYKRGYGLANLELSVPITSSSVFNVGSIAKQFTAMSILMLAQQGKLSLDDDVRKYVPEVPDFGTPITLRHLLHHTSGLRDFLEMLEMKGWRTGGDVTTEKDILDTVSRQRTLNHRPGDEFVYTNTGYVLLAIVVKRVTGEPLDQFAEANIFRPLGMTNTHFYDDHRTIIKGLVDGYLPRKGEGFLKWMPASDYIGSSNLFTTIEDLARWDQNFYDKKVAGAAVIEQMLTPGTLNDGVKLEYAGGLFITSYKGLKTVFHSGSTLGYQGTLHRFPDQHFSVTILCNVRGNNPDALARGVGDIYLGDQFKQTVVSQGEPITAPADGIKLSEKELSRVTGLYWNPVADTVRRVYMKDGKVMYFRAPGNESELAPLDRNRFLMLGVRNRVEISFQPSHPGEPAQMIFSEAGRKPSIQELVKPASYTPQQLFEFAGEYFSPEVDATYKIVPQGDKLLIRTGNWGDFLLSPRFIDSFANQEEMGSVMFTRDARKRVSGFVMRSGKVRNLRFDKVK
jgi:CubicO group peptidase (beta-lactamase class C family)